MVEEKELTLINNTGRLFHTSMGEFAQGEQQTLPEAEAKSLLDYAGIVDAAKYTAPTSEVARLKKENDELRKAKAEQTEEIVKLKAEIEELQTKP